MKWTRAALCGAIMLAAPGMAAAQGKYPDHPIKIIVPFTPGGIVDTIARANGNLQKDVEKAVGDYLYGETRRRPVVFVTVTRI